MKKKNHKINKLAKLLPKRKKPTEVKLTKLYTYIIVVNYGLGDQVMKLLQSSGSNMQLTCLGRGTANKEVLHILGLEGNRKDIVIAFVDENNIPVIKTELEKHFSKNKKAMGMGFTIPLTSIVGQKVYQFLTNSL